MRDLTHQTITDISQCISNTKMSSAVQTLNSHWGKGQVLSWRSPPPGMVSFHPCPDKRPIGLSPEEEVILSTLSKRLNISLYDSVFLRILAQFFSLPSFLFLAFSEFSVFTSLKAFNPLPAWASEKLAYNSWDSDQFSLTILSRIRPASDWQWMCLLQKVSPKPIKGFMAIYGLGSDIFDQTKPCTSQRFFLSGVCTKLFC